MLFNVKLIKMRFLRVWLLRSVFSSLIKFFDFFVDENSHITNIKKNSSKLSFTVFLSLQANSCFSTSQSGFFCTFHTPWKLIFLTFQGNKRNSSNRPFVIWQPCILGAKSVCFLLRSFDPFFIPGKSDSFSSVTKNLQFP